MTTEGGNWKELTTAATKGDLHTVKYHLDMGMNPNFQHPEFMTTPLIEAARAGNVAVVKLLLEHDKSKADPTIVADWEGCTPMEEAMKEKHHAVVDLLLKVVPEDYKHECLTIWMTGTYHRDLVEHLLTTGHCVVVTAELEGTEVCGESLQAKTGNKKLFVQRQPAALHELFNLAKGENSEWHPKAIDVWLHIPKNSNYVVKELGSLWKSKLDDSWHVPFRNDCRQVLLLMDFDSFAGRDSTQEQLAWLLTSDAIDGFACCVVLKPSRWWFRMTRCFWYNTWCESVLHLLTDMARQGGVMGKVYTYKRRSIDELPPVDKIAGDLQVEWEQEMGSTL